MANLGKIYNSIKDGMSKAEDWFTKPENGPTGGEEAGNGNSAAKSRLRDALGLDADKDTPKRKNADNGGSRASDAKEEQEAVSDSLL